MKRHSYFDCKDCTASLQAKEADSISRASLKQHRLCHKKLVFWPNECRYLYHAYCDDFLLWLKVKAEIFQTGDFIENKLKCVIESTETEMASDLVTRSAMSDNCCVFDTNVSLIPDSTADSDTGMRHTVIYALVPLTFVILVCNALILVVLKKSQRKEFSGSTCANLALLATADLVFAVSMLLRILFSVSIYTFLCTNLYMYIYFINERCLLKAFEKRIKYCFTLLNLISLKLLFF